MKKCPGCGETNPAKFGQNKSRKGGLQNRCKACMNASNTASYAKYHEQRQAYQRQYSKEHQDEIVENVRRWRIRKLDAALSEMQFDNPS